MRVTIVGTEGRLGHSLAALYREDGHVVREIALRPNTSADAIVERIAGEPIDLLIFTDEYEAPDRRIADVTRAELRAGLERLTFMPFRIAALLRPALAAGDDPKLVLVTRRSATMEHADIAGRYLERPFRAAAHQLWRCLAVEWREFGIDCRVVAIDDPQDDAAMGRLPRIIAENGAAEFVDDRGRPLRW